MFAGYEAKIIERLRERVPDFPVFTLDELERVPEYRQRAPAIFVIYDGYSVIELAANSRAAAIGQEWLIVAAAKNATEKGDAILARVSAAEIALQVTRALLGFDCGGGNFLGLLDAPGPEFDGGYCYLPMLFRVRGTIVGTAQ